MIQSGFKFIEVERMECESFQNYLERCNFISNNFKTGKYDLDVLIKKSQLFYSIKILKCKYNEKILSEIENMVKYSDVSL